MTWEALSLIGGTLALCAASGVVPIINAELVVFTAVVAAPGSPYVMIPALVVAASLGQMIAKSAMYFGGAGLAKVPKGKMKAAIDRYRKKIEDHAAAPSALLFASASIGLPPFYVVSILAGTLAIPFWRFAVIGMAGRMVRFAIVAALPEVARSVFGASI